MSDAEAVGLVGLVFDVPLMKHPIDFHCVLGSIMEEGREANIIVGCFGGSGGGGVHHFSELLVFPSDGCYVVELEEIGWVVRWVGAVGWDEGGMFDGC